MTNKVMEVFAKMLFRFTEPEETTCSGCGEVSPVCYCEEEPLSNCCIVHFTYPGWPDSDMCSKCFEHADVNKNE